MKSRFFSLIGMLMMWLLVLIGCTGDNGNFTVRDNGNTTTIITNDNNNNNNTNQDLDPSSPAVSEPTNLTGSGASGQVTLSWTNPREGDFDYIEIRFSPDAEGIGQPLRVFAPGTTKTITGLRNGQSYSFTITAVNTFREKSESVSVSITPEDNVQATGGSTGVTPGSPPIVL